jgi:hypothetical protein
MRTFAQKQDQPQKPVSSSFARSNTAILGPNHRVNPLLYVQRTLGNQALRRPLRISSEELKAALNGMASPLFGHDFSRIPIHPPAATTQMKRATNKSGDECEQEAERVANQVLAVSAHTGIQMRASRLSSTASPSTAVIQPKLKVGEPNDKFEQEADQVADKVMKMPAPLSPATAISTSASVHPSSHCVGSARGGGRRLFRSPFVISLSHALAMILAECAST